MLVTGGLCLLPFHLRVSRSAVAVKTGRRPDEDQSQIRAGLSDELTDLCPPSWLNRVQFGPPNTSSGSALFGKITNQVNNPRQVQLATADPTVTDKENFLRMLATSSAHCSSGLSRSIRSWIICRKVSGASRSIFSSGARLACWPVSC